MSRVSWNLRWRSPAQFLPCGRCWASAKTLNEKGTAVNKKYQKSTRDAPGAHGLTVPEHVTVAMAEIVGDMREALLALAVGAGLQVMSAMMEADVTGLAGVKGKHASDRGSSALRKAVVDVLDHPIIARCQLHKIRNVQDKLPQHLRGPVGTKMRAAYHADSALLAQAQLQALARELDKTHPRVAASLREGLAETLTVLRLGVPPTLARTLRSTNAIWVSMIGVCRQRAANVKRWRDGDMAMRWCAAGMVEAGKQFRRVNGHLHLASLRAALEREVAETVGATCHDDLVSMA